jgi:molybdopterin converting factor small subunit
VPHVVAADADFRARAGGLAELDIEADTYAGLIDALDRRFPGLGDHVRRRMAVAIDGVIHQDPGPLPLSPTSEVCLIPRIGGG